MQLSGRGLALSVIASSLFALLPGYVKLLEPLDSWQVFAYRVAWSLPLLLLLIWFTKQWPTLLEAFGRLRRERLLWLLCPLAALLVGVQWWMFLWAPLAGRVLEVSMGFFLLPLAMVLTGRLFYGERLRPLQQLAVFCAVLGVAHELWRAQAFSWPTLVTALGYPPYFILRRWMRLDALSGLVIELMFMLPLALGIIFLFGVPGTLTHRPELWLLLPGVAILGTLAMAAMMASSRLLPMGLFGILQYVEPVLLFVVALFVLNETITAQQWFTYIPIWLAVVLAAGDSYRLLRKQKQQI